MFKLLIIMCALMLLGPAMAQQYDEMTHDEIISESQLCGESNFNENNCMQKPNCVFLHWKLRSLNEKLRLCMSYSEIMKYYVKNPTEYIKKNALRSHKTITKSNFCDIMDDNEFFLEHRGNIEKCSVSTV